VRAESDSNLNPDTTASSPNTRARVLSNPFSSRDSSSANNFVQSNLNNFTKNAAKGVNSTLAELIRNTIMDKSDKRPWNMAVYNTFSDSLLSRVVVDTGIGAAINATKNFIPPEITQAVVAAPMVGAMRSLTSSRNTITQMAEEYIKNNPEKEELINNVQKLPIMKLHAKLSVDGYQKVKKHLDAILHYGFGVKAPEEVRDSLGLQIIDEEYLNKEEKKRKDLKYLETNAKINNLHFSAALAGVFGSTLFLPKGEKPSGFEDVNNPLRAIAAQGAHMFARVHTNFFSKFGSLLKGRNWDDNLDDGMFRKLSNSSAQYLADDLASCMPGKDILGPVPTSILMRFIAESIIPFFTLGTNEKEAKDRIPEEYRYIDYKFVRPVLKTTKQMTKPIFKFLFKDIYGKYLGGIYKDIPGMYHTKEEAAKEEQKKLKYLDEQFAEFDKLDSSVKTKRLTKEVLKLPNHLSAAIKDNFAANQRYDNTLKNKVARHEIKLLDNSHQVLEKVANEIKVLSPELKLDHSQILENILTLSPKFTDISKKAVKLKPEYYRDLSSRQRALNNKKKASGITKDEEKKIDKTLAEMQKDIKIELDDDLSIKLNGLIKEAARLCVEKTANKKSQAKDTAANDIVQRKETAVSI
jgi:hypothetical protein